MTAERFAGKVAIVTGGGSGMGRATALRFAAEGAKVIVADINGDNATKVAGEIGASAIGLKVDVTQRADVAGMVQEAMSRFGRLDFAFNNAGIPGPTDFKVHEIGIANWDQVIAVNLTGIFHCICEQVPAMKLSGGGAIVNTSSVAGVSGAPNMAAYIASKHGVVGLTRGGALDLVRDGIRMNAICPGAIDTPMLAGVMAEPLIAKVVAESNPIGRFATPDEIATVVLFLCSDEASYIVGHALPIDGGMMAA